LRCIIGNSERKHLAERRKEIPPFYATGILAAVLTVVHIYIDDTMSASVDINGSIILKRTLIIHYKGVNRSKQAYLRDQWRRAVTSGVWLNPVS